MTERVETGGLQVAQVLYDFINTEALPGLGLDADAVWASFGAIVDEMAPRNRGLLARREELQATIDDWHKGRQGQPVNAAEYQAFLRDIGYLVAEGEAFSAETRNTANRSMTTSNANSARMTTWVTACSTSPSGTSSPKERVFQ